MSRAFQQRPACSDLLGRPAEPREFTSLLLYPRVFEDFARHLATYGDVSALPTPAFLEGIKPGEPSKVGAPMPGLVVTVAVHPGDTIEEGQKLLSLEAMKMETTILAGRDGAIAEVLVSPGTPLEAGELLIRYEA